MVWALLTGLGLGLLVAAQIGPISLLCIRTVLRGAWRSGLAIGAAAACVDAGYAAAGSLGAAGLLALAPLRTALGLLGAAVLVVLGVRALRAPTDAAEPPVETATPARAFRTALAATAANPTTIASWAAIFLAASTADVTETPAESALVLVGIFCGTLGWFSALTGVLALLRRRVGPRVLRAVDVVSGSGLIVFGVALAVRAL